MTPIERFMSKVEMEPNSGCWLWTDAAGPYGHGAFEIDWREGTTSAHRAAWRLFVGPIPEGKHILHKCDVGGCVNVDHLYIGTNADNVKDRDARRGRYPRGGGKKGRSTEPMTLEEIVALLRLPGIPEK